jgi:hypothetical protein
MEDVLKDMATLRGQRRYRDAVTLLRAQAGREDFTMAQHARLSFEIGLLLQDRLDAAAGACRHWRAHAEKYPENGERAERVNAYIKACDTPAQAPEEQE